MRLFCNAVDVSGRLGGRLQMWRVHDWLGSDGRLHVNRSGSKSTTQARCSEVMVKSHSNVSWGDGAGRPRVMKRAMEQQQQQKEEEGRKVLVTEGARRSYFDVRDNARGLRSP